MDLIPETSEHYAHDFDIDLAGWTKPKPHGISGLFRFKDEEEFGRFAIVTHLDWLDEVVVILNNSNDATRLMVETLQSEMDNLRLYQDMPEMNVYEYPYELAQIKTKEHETLPENSVHSLVHYTNWGMSKCKYSWIAKIEGDVIALSSFARIREEIDENPQIHMYYGRYGLNVAGLKGELFDYDTPRNAGWDEGVCNNNPSLYRCVKHGVWESIDFHQKPKKNMGFSFLHLKRCKKKYQSYSFDQDWRPFQPDIVREALQREAQNYQGPDGICPSVLFEKTGVEYA